MGLIFTFMIVVVFTTMLGALFGGESGAKIGAAIPFVVTFLFLAWVFNAAS